MKPIESCQMLHEGPGNVIVSPPKLMCPVRDVERVGYCRGGYLPHYFMKLRNRNRAKEVVGLWRGGGEI